MDWKSSQIALSFLAPGQYADFAVLEADFSTVPEADPRIETVPTVVGGDVVYAAEQFRDEAPQPLPAVQPTWSPVAVFGGWQRAVSPAPESRPDALRRDG